MNLGYADIPEKKNDPLYGLQILFHDFYHKLSLLLTL
ncbi:unknown [[Mannheimia] succiniciproducens MBEL55E]|uniref:Uncharacterized protein n=1 Tax=Mannheimia succiniciproducens (strain KCTC 0769BP / MBEL55E) TaxID=221988 RepID=Q65SS6_MANSM|nr:unknown [[Mannheimia] succiniciproducens MBEL55E]